MENIVNQSFVVDEEEKQSLLQTVEILKKINKELENTPSYIIDEQKFDDAIEEVINIALKIELKKVYSVFNSLSDEQRSRINKEVYSYMYTN